MTKFRPCIDLHKGCVKQIVGGTLRDDLSADNAATNKSESTNDGGTVNDSCSTTDSGQPVETLVENFVADKPAAWFAELYAKDNLTGGHVIKLGPGNDEAARAALAAYPGGLQIGGGINSDNAAQWLDAGASHVIVTSWLFDANGRFLEDRLRQLAAKIGRERIVVDLSCRRTDEGWIVAMNRWQTLTDLPVAPDRLQSIAQYADEFLIHAADVEGLCRGIDAELVALMGNWAGLPMTYAGGVATKNDVELVDQASGGTVDVTVGSALDIFGGSGVRYDEMVRWNLRA